MNGIAAARRLLVVVYAIIYITWINLDKLNGFEDETGADGKGTVSFNYHSMFMSLAFPVFMGSALTAFYTSFERGTQKTLHIVFHVFALISTVIGLVCIFTNHSDKGIVHLYSVHSWIGVLTLVFMFVQLVLGAYIFGAHSPDLSGDQWKVRSKAYSPYHRFFGVVVYLLGLATCCMGLMEKQAFLASSTGGDERHWTRTAPVLLAGILAILGVLVTMQITMYNTYGEKKDKDAAAQQGLLSAP